MDNLAIEDNRLPFQAKRRLIKVEAISFQPLRQDTLLLVSGPVIYGNNPYDTIKEFLRILNDETAHANDGLVCLIEGLVAANEDSLLRVMHNVQIRTASLGNTIIDIIGVRYTAVLSSTRDIYDNPNLDVHVILRRTPHNTNRHILTQVRLISLSCYTKKIRHTIPKRIVAFLIRISRKNNPTFPTIIVISV